MTYRNNSLSDNYEISLLRSMLIIITVCFCILGAGSDGNPTNNFAIWMYFLAISPVVLIFTLFIKKNTNILIVVLSMTLVFSILIFNEYLFYDIDEISLYKISLLFFHLIVIIYFFWKASRTLLIEDVEVDLSMFNKTEGLKNSRKIIRRSNRRGKSRAKNSTKIKSGQYRG